jgi:hypothetical protein
MPNTIPNTIPNRKPNTMPNPMPNPMPITIDPSKAEFLGQPREFGVAAHGREQHAPRWIHMPRVHRRRGALTTS